MSYQPFRPGPQAADRAGPLDEDRTRARCDIATNATLRQPPGLECRKVARVARSQLTGSDFLPAHVATGLDHLAAALPLLDDWAHRVGAARRMALEWDAQARRLGWTDADLYGLHPLAPAARRDAKGLAWCLDRGDRVTAMTADSAMIETAAANWLRFYRTRHDTGAVVAWQLATAAQDGAGP